jgi:hypothetical protein
LSGQKVGKKRRGATPFFCTDNPREALVCMSSAHERCPISDPAGEAVRASQVPTCRALAGLGVTGDPYRLRGTHALSESERNAGGAEMQGRSYKSWCCVVLLSVSKGIVISARHWLLEMHPILPAYRTT